MDEGRVFVGAATGAPRRRARQAGEWSRSRRPRERGGVRVILREDDLGRGRQARGHARPIPDHGGSAHALVARDRAALGIDACAAAPDVAARPRCQRRRRLRARRRPRLNGSRGLAREGDLRAALRGRLPCEFAGAGRAAPGTRLSGARGSAPSHRCWARPGRGHDPLSRRARTARGAAMLARRPADRAHSPDPRAREPTRARRSWEIATYGGPARVTLPTGRVLEPRPHGASCGARRRPRRSGAPLVARPPSRVELEVAVVRAWRGRRGVGAFGLVRAP